MENTSHILLPLASTNYLYSNIKELQLSDHFYILHTLMQVFPILISKTRWCKKTKVFSRVYSMHIFKALILVNKNLDFQMFIKVSSDF